MTKTLSVTAGTMQKPKKHKRCGSTANSGFLDFGGNVPVKRDRIVKFIGA